MGGGRWTVDGGRWTVDGVQLVKEYSQVELDSDLASVVICAASRHGSARVGTGRGSVGRVGTGRHGSARVAGRSAQVACGALMDDCVGRAIDPGRRAATPGGSGSPAGHAVQLTTRDAALAALAPVCVREFPRGR